MALATAKMTSQPAMDTGMANTIPLAARPSMLFASPCRWVPVRRLVPTLKA